VQHEVTFEIIIRLKANSPEAAEAWAALWLKQALSAHADQDCTGVNVHITLTEAHSPAHVHYHQTEAWTVDEGRIAYQYPGEQPRYAGPGETVTFPPGAPHRWWNPDDVPLRCHGYVEPADNIEYFLSAIFDAQRRGGGPGRSSGTWRS
jgi:mannose-6-phosphate isomerase-like protein (cupin superfamily)